jgi:hypothetical protein
VQGSVQLPVPAPVEPVADHLPGGGRDGGDAGQHGEGRLRAQPTRVRPADQQLRGGDRSDARLGEQHRRDGLDQRP